MGIQASVHFHFGVRQEEQVLACVLDVAEPLVACSGLLDAEPSPRQGRPVDPFQPQRFEPVVASAQLECRRGRRSRKFITESHRIGRDHHPGAARAVPVGGSLPYLHGIRESAAALASTSGPAARPGRARPIGLRGFDIRQVGPDLHQEPLIARRQGPAACVQPHHGEVCPAGANARRSRAATVRSSTEPRTGRRPTEEHGDEQAAETRHLQSNKRPLAVPKRSPVGIGQCSTSLDSHGGGTA